MEEILNLNNMTTIKETNIKPTIKECFETDLKLISTYHIYSGDSLDSCVDKTFTDLDNIKERLSFYKINIDNKLIGFFGIEDLESIKALTGFFLKPEYRHLKNEFWKAISQEIKDKYFLCGIYQKNTRAKNFLEQMNGKIAISDDKGVIYLMENVCH